MKIQQKFLLLLPLLLYFSASSFSQQGKNSHLAFKSLSGTDTLIQEVFLGGLFNKEIWVIRNPKKDTLEISEVKNGKLHGEQKLYYENGDFRLIANYKKGLLDGKTIYYLRRGGKISKIENYKALPNEEKSILHGKVKIYHNNEVLSEDLNYKNGFKNGKYKLYHQNGELKEQGKYQDDLNIDQKLSYLNNGALMRVENYIIIDNPKYIKLKESIKNDKNESAHKEIQNIPQKISVLDGKVKYYNRAGQITSDLNFKKGKKEGVNKEYHSDKNNTLKSSEEYKDGLPHGAFIRYNFNGELERKGIYYREIEVGDTVYKNVYDGEIFTYYKGKIQRIEHWKNFMRNGVQEDYSQHSGKLYQRTHFEDNLKVGVEERFDANGIKNYEAYYEIIEVEGKRISQKTGLETSWKDGEVTTKTNWKNGIKEGETRTYYLNGGIERIMTFRNGELEGKYQTYYENGQLKEDYFYNEAIRSNYNKYFGWNRVYDESGELSRIFYAKGNGDNLLELRFRNGKLNKLFTQNALNISISNNKKLESISWHRYSRPAYGYDFFSNQKLRRVHFTADKQHSATANFTSTGQFIQIYNATGNLIEEENLENIANNIADQYNPKWHEESLIKDGFKDGKHQWSYADGTPFFEIEFKDSLPHGNWITYNPNTKDTIIKREYVKGLPVGEWIEKTVDGVIKSRVSYYDNHKEKVNLSYANEGKIREIKKFDTLGKEIYYADYFENGNLKSMREPILGNYLYMRENGDTSSFNFLFIDGDSIKLERQFYEGNLIKLERRNNITLGKGEVKTYFENGQVKTSHQMGQKKSNGAYKKYDEDGNLLTLGYFSEGKRHGQWINYEVEGEPEISLFDNGEFIIDKSEEDPNACRCYDKTLQSGTIGYAGGLSHFEEFDNIKSFIPKKVIPIDEFNYGNIFYLNLQTDNNRDGGYTSMKLLMFKEFSFHYPDVDYLKFELNPCKTEGYISNIEGSFRYGFRGEGTVYATLNTNKIAVSLQNNPLVQKEKNSPFEVLLDTKGMDFDNNGIKQIRFINEDSTCFPLGIINDFIEIDITKASLNFRPSYLNFNTLPLLPNESDRFYGLNIEEANLSFIYKTDKDSIKIDATAHKILAGANYVAGRINVEGKQTNDKFFKPKGSKIAIDVDLLQRYIEQKGFYRVKIEIVEGNMAIEFYTEK